MANYNPSLVRIESQIPPHEHKLLKEHALNMNMTVPQYIRFAINFCMVMEGNKNAITNEAHKVWDYIKNKVRKREMIKI